MKGKVKFEGSAPAKAPKAVKVEGPRPAPMASDKMRKVKTRGTGAAIKGTTHMGC